MTPAGTPRVAMLAMGIDSLVGTHLARLLPPLLLMKLTLLPGYDGLLSRMGLGFLSTETFSLPTDAAPPV